MLPSQLSTLLSYVTGIIAILGYIFQAAFAIINFFFPGLIDLNSSWNGVINLLYSKAGMAVIIIIQFLFSIFLLYKCITYYSDSKWRFVYFPKEFHQLTHRYRDLRANIELRKESKLLDNRELVSLIQNYCRRLLDSLCTLLTGLLGYPVYGCIKQIDANGLTTPRAITNETVSDFVRSSNTPDDRKSDRKPKQSRIRDNTDFLELMDYNNIRNQFYQPNLLEYAKELQEDDHEYKNSTRNWQDFYLGTVVVPIQIENELCINSETEAYNVVGFLCVDTNKKNVFKKKYKVPITDLVKAYADLLYCVFKLYNSYIDVEGSSTYNDRQKATSSTSEANNSN